MTTWPNGTPSARRLWRPARLPYVHVTPDEFREHGHALIDWIADYIEGIEAATRVATRRCSRATCAPRFRRTRRPPPNRSRRCWPISMRVIVPGITHWQHPSFFAYFPSNSSYSSILGELASAGLGVQGMSWVTSPACTEVETLDARLDAGAARLARPVPQRLSATGGGVIHGSASEATLAAILAADGEQPAVMSTAMATPSISSHTQRRRRTAASRRGCASPASAVEHMRIVPHDDELRDARRRARSS